jgi:hypothetical protein
MAVFFNGGNRMLSARVIVGMRRHIVALCIVALGLGTVAGCNNAPVGSAGTAPNASSPASGVGASASSGSASGPAGVPSATPSPHVSIPGMPVTHPPILVNPPKPIDTDGGSLTLTGTTYAGAEPTCILMAYNKAVYLLLADDSAHLRAGERAILTGHVEKGVMTHCQQGIPFAVTNIDQLAPAH